MDRKYERMAIYSTVRLRPAALSRLLCVKADFASKSAFRPLSPPLTCVSPLKATGLKQTVPFMEPLPTSLVPRIPQPGNGR